MFRTILHPTDLSEASLPALSTAHALAKELGSSLTVCYIANPPLVATGHTVTNPTTDETKDIAAEVDSHQPLDPAVQREIRILITDASTGVKSLLKMLHDKDCDLLVLGMHKRTGVAGWFGPSITEEVVRRAECDVLVVKAPGSAEKNET